MINTYSAYVQYFRQLATSHNDIKDFVVGNSERIISQERKDLLYPVLWLEDPEVSFKNNDSLRAIYSGNLVVLINTKVDDWQGQDLVLDRTFQICRDLILRMLKDGESGNFFELSPDDISMDPIHTYTHAADHGWRIGFSINEILDSCVNVDRWTSAESLPHLSFEWSIADNILTFDMDAAAADIIIRAVPGGPAIFTGTLEDEINVSSFPATFYLYMTTMEESVEIKASAMIIKSVVSGHSVPYFIK